MNVIKKINKNIRLTALLSVLVLTSVIIFQHNIKTFAVENPQQKSLGMQGKIPADPPTIPARITFPSSGQNVTTLPIKVGGTCSGDVLVKLFKNGVFAGSAQCINGTFSISIDLFSGTNELLARVYDALDQVGPDSNTVSVSFTPSGFNNTGPRVSLTSDYAKRGANHGESLSWPIILSGGVGPYAISVDWGDNTVELISKSASGQIDISHKYAKAGVYTVIIKVTDANGVSAFLQLVAVANGALSQDNQSANTVSAANTKTVVLWWPVIAAAFLVVLSFWLGSMSRLYSLRKQAEKRINY